MGRYVLHNGTTDKIRSKFRPQIERPAARNRIGDLDGEDVGSRHEAWQVRRKVDHLSVARRMNKWNRIPRKLTRTESASCDFDSVEPRDQAILILNAEEQSDDLGW